MRLLALTIHEGFSCIRRDADGTSLMAAGLAARPVNTLSEVCLPPSRLCEAVSRVVSAVLLRTPVNNAG
jgi:hypothetical protein